MKLERLHKPNHTDVLRQYLRDLRNLYESYAPEYKRVLSEAKITITIDDDQKINIDNNARSEFVEKAQKLGQFDNQEWVNNLVKSMEQAGVQGFNKICEDEKPVTTKQVQELIHLLVNLISR